jgi:hypothetical protein
VLFARKRLNSLWEDGGKEMSVTSCLASLWGEVAARKWNRTGEALPVNACTAVVVKGRVRTRDL